MKYYHHILTLIVLATLGSAFGVPATPSPPLNEDQTLSPYFLVLTPGESEAGGRELLPLKSTKVEVRIDGVIAKVNVRQVYHNTGSSALEAIYVFPGSTRAAVNGLTMQVGDRVTEARIEEKAEAKKIYEQAKEDNKSASLLEQKRPNVFQMNVANILPGDRIEVTLRYTEHLVPTDQIYEFVYPTVVGPRYSNAPADSADKWVSNPYLQEGAEDPTTFDIQVEVATGMALQELVCASHPVNVEYEGPNQARVTLDGSEENGGNRDYTLRYRLAGNQIESGLLLHRDDKLSENFFLLTVQPPERVRPDQIPGREYLFVVDVSGSMNGFPLNTAKALMRELVDDLRATDQFNILLFASDSRVLNETGSVPATEANVRRAVSWLESTGGGGGTEMVRALRRALDLPGNDNMSRTIVVISDGYVSFERDAFDLIRNNLNRSNLFAFGIGSSVNRFLIEGMARAGRGEPFIVTDPKDAPAVAEQLRRYISAPVLTGIDIDFDGLEVYDVEPASVPDVLADRPITVFGKWRGTPKGTITVSGTSGKERMSLTIPVEPEATDHPSLPYLWARDRIATLADYQKAGEDSETRRQIVSLGLTYNLLTEYTSFVAVDEVRRDTKGLAREAVKQPLPLPQGVPASAVGGGTIPEPPFYLLIPAALAAFLKWRHLFTRKAA